MGALVVGYRLCTVVLCIMFLGPCDAHRLIKHTVPPVENVNRPIARLVSLLVLVSRSRGSKDPPLPLPLT